MSGVGTCRVKTLTGSGKGDKLDFGYSSPQKRTKSYLNCNESNEFPSSQHQNVRRKSGSLILEDGWIMGPLGLPVRETLEVGHRGTQKAFNQKSPSHQRTSERSEIDVDPHNLHSHFPEQEHVSENNPDELATAVYHRRRSVFDVEVTDEKKEQKAKQMQLEQNRALEQQIREKAAKAAAEKEKRDKEEAQEAARWEAERIAIMEEFAREQSDLREKMEADFKIAEKKYLEEMRREEILEDMKREEIRCAEETRIVREAEERLEAIRVQDREWEAERRREEDKEKEEKEKEKELLRLQEEARQKEVLEAETEKQKEIEAARLNLQKIEIVNEKEREKEQKKNSSLWSSLFSCFSKPKKPKSTF